MELQRLHRAADPIAIAVSSAMAAVVVLVGWHGADLPGQVYRVSLFRTYGFLTYDTFWYGGHYLVTYSLLSPMLASVIGLRALGAASVVLSAVAFGRLAVRHLPQGAMPGTVVFALGLSVPLVVGQITFLNGLAFGLWALVVLDRRWRVAGAVLALASTLASPLAGLFTVLAILSWAIAARDRRGALVPAIALAAAPFAVSAFAFSEAGAYGFPVEQLVAVLLCAGIGWLVVPAALRPVRVGFVLYAGLAVVLFVVANPVGGNLVRLGSYVAPALAVATCWPRRRRMLALVIVPALFWQCSTGITAIVDAHGDPSRSASYFAPVVDQLVRQPGPGRVEIPFTLQHWEAAYVAPRVALARGWERQVDKADNPLFYGRDPLSPAAYRTWLVQNGVSWVALPDAPLDEAGRQEAALVRQGQPFLRPLWHNAHWQLYAVTGSPGLVSGPARLEVRSPSSFALTPTSSGPVVVRFRFTHTWTVVDGTACLAPTADGWTKVDPLGPGPVVVVSRPLGRARECDATPSGR